MDPANLYNDPSRKLKRVAISALLAAVLLFVFVFIKNNSFILIEASAEPNQQITYEVADPKGKTKEHKSPGGSKRVRVGTGDYGVSVKIGDKSYFAAVKGNGFLRTSKVTPSLAPEKKRTFVGNNPSLCMEYLVTKLVSYACSDRFENISVHVPANASTPTYVLKNPNKTVGGFVEGTVKTNAGTYALVKQVGVGETLTTHTIYLLGDDLGTSNTRTLSDLDPESAYGLASYREGFLAYSLTESRAFYYKSLDSKPEEIKFEKPGGQSLTATSLSTKGGSMLVLYAPPADSSSKKTSVEAHIKSTGTWKVLSLKGNYTGAVLCGTDKLCVVGSETMYVYDTKPEKPKLLYSIKNVISVKGTGEGVMVIRSRDVLRFDADKRAGFIDFSFGDYLFAGLQPQPSGYILSLTNNKGKKVALLVDGQEPDEDSIDKKVAQLLANESVDDVSAYGAFVFVSPAVGPLIFIESIGGLGYDPTVVKQKNADIIQAINSIGIDRTKYTVVSTIK